MWADLTWKGAKQVKLSTKEKSGSVYNAVKVSLNLGERKFEVRHLVLQKGSKNEGWVRDSG